MTKQGKTPVIGVRLSNSSRLRFVAVESGDISPGSWITVQTEHGDEVAQVVITPDQMTMCADDAPSSLESPADPRLIGGTGFFDPSRCDVSREDELFRDAKRRVPRLGWSFQTGRGRATVISLNVFKDLATIRYDETGEQETRSAAGLLDIENPISEDE